jgi:hypothetical protein
MKTNIMFTVPVVKGWTRFCDIPNGGHFKDNAGRRFIKLVDKTACGIPQTFGRLVAKSEYGPKSEPLLFNSVDYDGYVGTCPAWVPFKIVKKPK